MNHKEILRDCLKLFQDLFSYKASLFTAPSQINDQRLESTLNECGVKFLDVPRLEKKVRGNMLIRTKIIYIGKTNRYNQNYITRNAAFEPNFEESYATVEGYLHSIALEFKYNIPAIIINHRTVFTGSIDPKNREKGLRDFDNLLSKIIKKWPEIEFMTSKQLGDLISKKLHAKHKKKLFLIT